jgi:hypothetical protein
MKSLRRPLPINLSTTRPRVLYENMYYTIDDFMRRSDRRINDYKILFFDDNRDYIDDMVEGFRDSELESISKSCLVPVKSRMMVNKTDYLEYCKTYMNKEELLNTKLLFQYIGLYYNLNEDHFGEGLNRNHMNRLIEWANVSQSEGDNPRVVIFDFDYILNRANSIFPYNLLFPTIITNSGEKINTFTERGHTIEYIHHLIKDNISFVYNKINEPGTEFTDHIRRMYAYIKNETFTIRPSLLLAYYMCGSKMRFEKMKLMFEIFERNHIKFYILTNNVVGQYYTSLIDILREIHPSFTIRVDPNTLYDSVKREFQGFNIKLPYDYKSENGNVIISRRIKGKYIDSIINNYKVRVNLFTDGSEYRELNRENNENQYVSKFSKYQFLSDYFPVKREKTLGIQKLSLGKMYNGTQPFVEDEFEGLNVVTLGGKKIKKSKIKKVKSKK